MDDNRFRRPSAAHGRTSRRVHRLARLCATAFVCTLSAAPPSLASGDSPPAPGAHPWTLVALGDSLAMARPWDCPGCLGYPAYYGSALTTLTGRGVTVVNRAEPEIDSRQLLADVRADRSLRAQIARADIVTVTIGHNDTPWVESDDPCDGSDSDEQAN